jgi:hypothetical protein
MLIKQYEHRLPSNYDMSQIRDRGRTRGALWDNAEGLVFKAFALRERDKNGAPNNAYTSVYLWQSEGAAGEFVTGPGFKHVLETFGRPVVELWLPVDVRVGTTGAALSLYREDIPVKENTDLEALKRSEAVRNEQTGARPDTVASVVGLDVQSWRIVRFMLSSEPLRPFDEGKGYELVHLGAPGLDPLRAQAQATL